MVASAVPEYSEVLKHLRNTHRERVPGRTQVPALFPPPEPRNKLTIISGLPIGMSNCRG